MPPRFSISSSLSGRRNSSNAFHRKCIAAVTVVADVFLILLYLCFQGSVTIKEDQTDFAFSGTLQSVSLHVLHGRQGVALYGFQ